MPDNFLPVTVRDLCLSELESKGNESRLEGTILCPICTKQGDIINEKEMNKKER